MEEQQPQADGAYPRLNAAMVASGKYNGMIVSLVGKFRNAELFECADGATIALSGEHTEMPEVDPTMVVELVGQISEPTLVVVFVVRELSVDMDLAVYNKMLAVQHNPKFAQYFSAPVPSN